MTPLPGMQQGSDRTAHIATIRTLQTLLDVLELARKDWWNDPTKKLQHRQWEEACEEGKLRAVQKINNATNEFTKEAVFMPEIWLTQKVQTVLLIKCIRFHGWRWYLWYICPASPILRERLMPRSSACLGGVS